MTTPNPTDAYTQYDNAKPWWGQSNAPSWVGVNTADQNRVRAYILYERLYWSVPNTMAMIERGTDAYPVYLPSARKIVEACNRFLQVGWDYSIDKAEGNATDQAAADTLWKAFFKNQKVKAKHARQKRFGLIRGDHVWHVRANAAAPAGHRVYLHEVQPEQCFAILKEQNPDWIIGYHLVDLVPDPRDKTKQVCRRQTYRKVNEDPWEPSAITSEVDIFELGKWDDRVAPSNPTPTTVVVAVPNDYTRPQFTLPVEIVHLPVYLIPNQKEPCVTYGSSEIRGIETIVASINQTTTDEDLTLALQGLGLYWSTAGPPVGADGTPGVFDTSPGSVIEVGAADTFGRVSGVGSGLPGIEHMNFVLGQMQSGVGIPDIAAGVVDVAVAESGIALKLQLSPLLAKNSEKETEILAEEAAMFDHITNGWFVAYEGFGHDTGVVVTPIVQDPMPQDRAARFSEIISMVTAAPPVMSVRTAIVELNKIGYNIPPDELAQIQKEGQDRLKIDPFSLRIEAEQLAGHVPPTVPTGGVVAEASQVANAGAAKPKAPTGTPPSAPAKPVNGVPRPVAPTKP